MDKHVRVPIPLNETESLLVTEPLHDSFCHGDCPPFFFFVQLSGVTLEKVAESHLYAKDGIEVGSKIGILISVLNPGPSHDKG
jgi:hypothetical protein